MAKFSVSFPTTYGYMSAYGERGETLSQDELLEVLRPAAIRLKDLYRQAIISRFQQRTGSLAESIDFEDHSFTNYASFTVKPFGTHNGGKYTRKSRAGSPTRKYAKHGRHPSTKALKNEELGYFLEFGTPRISPPTHWMEEASEDAADEINEIVENNFTELLRRKGLL